MHGGTRVAAVAAAEYLASLYETLEVAAEPDLVAQISAGPEEVARGDLHSLEETYGNTGPDDQLCQSSATLEMNALDSFGGSAAAQTRSKAAR